MTIRLQCYCASLRQAARIISQRYDAALAPAELTITHFTLLTVLSDNPGVRVNDLVESLAMDQTTLSRTLKLMENADLIMRQESEDRRESRWALTTTGHARLRRAEPHWEAAQQEIESLLGEQDLRRLTESSFRLTRKLAT
jgi:DNA-binding MarR family transcriptional regulator